MATSTVLLSVLPAGDQAGDTAFYWLVESPPPLLQNVMHLVFYAGLAWSVAWSLEGVQAWRTRAITTFLACILLGIVLEWLQTFIPGRFGTILDVGLNAAGTLLGLQLARVAGKSGS